MWTQVNYNRRGIEDMNYGVSLTYAKNGPWKQTGIGINSLRHADFKVILSIIDTPQHPEG